MCNRKHASCCPAYRWRGVPSLSASAHSRHPGSRQLSRDPRDEAAPGRSHAEAGISGTTHTLGGAQIHSSCFLTHFNHSPSYFINTLQIFILSSTCRNKCFFPLKWLKAEIKVKPRRFLSPTPSSSLKQPCQVRAAPSNGENGLTRLGILICLNFYWNCTDSVTLSYFFKSKSSCGIVFSLKTVCWVKYNFHMYIDIERTDSKVWWMTMTSNVEPFQGPWLSSVLHL